MARIIVTTDESTAQGAPSILLEESVYPVHLSTDHAARQLIERLSWALGDAEAVERGRTHAPAERRRALARGPARGRRRARAAVARRAA